MIWYDMTLYDIIYYIYTYIWVHHILWNRNVSQEWRHQCFADPFMPWHVTLTSIPQLDTTSLQLPDLASSRWFKELEVWVLWRTEWFELFLCWFSGNFVMCISVCFCFYFCISFFKPLECIPFINGERSMIINHTTGMHVSVLSLLL
jgi:hypothetical protein